MTRGVDFLLGKMSLRCSWESHFPKWYELFFRQMCEAYYYSAQKSGRVYLRKTAPVFLKLIEEYYKVLSVKGSIKHSLAPVDIGAESYVLEEDKLTVMFTGGKDSAHLLLYLMKTTPKKNIQCVYVSNINRSESVYEKETAKNICEKLGIRFRLVIPANSIKLNRSDHNIGLREQLLVTLALPDILDFKSGKVYFGMHPFELSDEPALYTAHVTTFALFQRALNDEYGLNIELLQHPMLGVNELRITRELIEQNPDIFWLTNSCYRQQNFREQQHAICQKRHPGFKIYNGCGNCLKCLRINGVLALYEDSGSEAARAGMAREITEVFAKKHPDDHTLQAIVGLFTPARQTKKKPRAGEGTGLGIST